MDYKAHCAAMRAAAKRDDARSRGRRDCGGVWLAVVLVLAFLGMCMG